MRARLPLILGIAMLAAGCQQQPAADAAAQANAAQANAAQENVADTELVTVCGPDEVIANHAVAATDNIQTGGC